MHHHAPLHITLARFAADRPGNGTYYEGYPSG